MLIWFLNAPNQHKLSVCLSVCLSVFFIVDVSVFSLSLSLSHTHTPHTQKKSLWWISPRKNGSQTICRIKQKNDKVCRPTVVERSKSSILRSWMRKVVGSNPGDDLYRILFSFADTSIEKRRLLRETNWNDNNAMKTKQEVVRINLLRLVEPSNNIVWY